ncbi:hypothetical protein JW826_02285 [Candidatus Woesearchaeota archaeon]|nr:hypothetical protein [Candidatus Woesearchaeota archaeon]
MATKFVPLTSSFMLTSIIGFMVSVLFVMKMSVNWGFTFALFFVIMFISAIISMSNMEAETRHGWEELAIHEKKNRKGKAKK